jgi:hypothetical protein
MSKDTIKGKLSKTLQDFKPGDATIHPGLQQLAEAERLIQAKYDAEGGEAVLGPRVERSLGTMWRFGSSAICYDSDSNAAYYVFGAIYDKWRALGGLQFGTPCSDALVASDGKGRYNDFIGGGASIYWSAETGANMVYGAIRQRWVDLGAERSYLGYPTSDQVPFADEGVANDFQGGGIYHWADTGPIDLKDVVVHYTGMHCFGETDWDNADVFNPFAPTADEPYIIFALSTPKQAWGSRSRIETDVDSGESRPDLFELYRGRPYGLNIGIVLMEHDTGNPDLYKDRIVGALLTAHGAGTVALGLIPIVGPAVAAIAGPLLGSLMPELGGAINDALDTGDDAIGTTTITLSARDMVLLAAKTQNSKAGPIGFKVESPLISGDGASYKVYFGVVPA